MGWEKRASAGTHEGLCLIGARRWWGAREEDTTQQCHAMMSTGCVVWGSWRMHMCSSMDAHTHPHRITMPTA